MSLSRNSSPSVFSGKWESASIAFTADRDFSHEALQTIHRQFHSQIKELHLHALLSHDNKDTFIVHCDEADVENIVDIFIPLMTRLTENDNESDDEDPESEPHSNLRPNAQPNDNSTHEGQSDGHNVSYPDILSSQNFRFAWKCPNVGAPMESIISRCVKEKVESLTGCTLVMSPAQSTIYIGGFEEEFCHRALYKLDIIRKYFMTSDTESLSHLFYTEGEINAKFVFQTFASINSKLEQTTLLDWLQYPEGCKRGYGELKRTFTTRCCTWDFVRKFHALRKARPLSPAIRRSDMDKGFAVWVDYTYEGAGDKSCDDSIQSLLKICDEFGNQLADQWTRGIMEWTRGISEEPTPKQPPGLLRQDPFPDVSMQDTSTCALSNTESHRLTPSERPVKPQQGSEESISVAGGDLVTLDLPPTQADEDSHVHPRDFADISELELFLNSSPTLIKPKDGNFINPRFGVLKPQGNTNTNNQRLNRTEGNVIPKSEQKRPSGFQGHHKKSIMQQQVSESKLALGVAEPATTVLIPARAPVTTTDKSGTQDPRKGQQFSQATPSVNKGLHQAPRLGGSRGAQIPLTIRPMQPVSRGSLLIPLQNDPSERFLKRIKEMTGVIPPTMQNWCGEIRLEAQFGRILIRKPHERFLEPDISFDDETLIRHLLEKAPYQPITNFTRILTTISAEAQYLVDMTDEEGNLMWQPPQKWAVKYEFDWTDEGTNASYILEIDAETFASKVKFDSWKTGRVFVHCPLRLWDFMVSASRLHNAGSTKEGLHGEISESLYIQPGLGIAKLAFILSSEYFHMRLNGIRVRRNCQYLSSNEASILSITEVIDLKLTVRVADDGRRVFSATEYTAQSTPGCPHSWYEVAILSTAAQNAFKENESLEFGDETNWTAESLQKAGAFSAICLTACEMIKRMDGIGFYNINGAKVPSVPQSETGRHSRAPTERRDRETIIKSYQKLLGDNDFW